MEASFPRFALKTGLHVRWTRQGWGAIPRTHPWVLGTCLRAVRAHFEIVFWYFNLCRALGAILVRPEKQMEMPQA
jgi:hypothetical protein